MYNFNAEITKNDLIQWLQEWEKNNAAGCNFIVGISGGTDSSVVATLLVTAFGAERVFGVMMPNGEQSDISDSFKLIKHLGINYTTVNIRDAFMAIKHEVRPALNDRWSTQTSINLAPRLRMTTLYAVSQSMNGRVSNNSNLSEKYLGYYTRWADNVGDFSPLSNLTKTEVKEIGKALGLPDDLVYKVPSDGLCGKTDEDNFGFSYDVLDKYIRTGEIEDLETKKKIDEMHQKNLFKLQPMPSFKY